MKNFKRKVEAAGWILFFWAMCSTGLIWGTGIRDDIKAILVLFPSVITGGIIYLEWGEK